MKIDKYLTAITGNYKYDLYNYMAAVYRGEKVYKALLLQGGRSTGKSRISRLMGAKQISPDPCIFNDRIFREKMITIETFISTGTERSLADTLVNFADYILSVKILTNEKMQPSKLVDNITNVIIETHKTKTYIERWLIPVKLQQTDIIPEFTDEDEKIFIAYLKDNY